MLPLGIYSEAIPTWPPSPTISLVIPCCETIIMLRNICTIFIFIFFAAFTSASRLNVTAIGAQHGTSTLECWEVDSPLYESGDPTTAGTSVFHLGNVSTLSWSVAPPGEYVGPHNAPSHQ